MLKGTLSSGRSFNIQSEWSAEDSTPGCPRLRGLNNRSRYALPSVLQTTMKVYTCAKCQTRQQGEPHLWENAPLCFKCYANQRMNRWRRDLLDLLIFSPVLIYFVLVSSITGSVSLMETVGAVPLLWLCGRLHEWYRARIN